MLVTIRSAEDRDVGLLAELNRFVLDMHVDALPTYFKRAEQRAVADSFRSMLERPEVQAYIASIGDVPVGYAVVAFRERPENALCLARRSLEIDELAVSPSHRRRGVCRALVERALAEARSQGVSEVEVTSWVFNTDARAAFQALGFKPMLLRYRHGS
jgi:ribosomal protein S18 acetylase RimI-like enzyme